MPNWNNNTISAENLSPSHFTVLLEWLNENPHDRLILPCMDQEILEIQHDSGDVDDSSIEFMIFTSWRPALENLLTLSNLLKGPTFTFSWHDTVCYDYPGCSGEGVICNNECSMDTSGIQPHYLSDRFRVLSDIESKDAEDCVVESNDTKDGVVESKDTESGVFDFTF